LSEGPGSKGAVGCSASEKMTWRFLLLCIGQGGLLASSFLLYITFLMAFLQGNELVIYTNHYGEALLEFFVLPVLIVLGMHSVNELLLKGK